MYKFLILITTFWATNLRRVNIDQSVGVANGQVFVINPRNRSDESFLRAFCNFTALMLEA